MTQHNTQHCKTQHDTTRHDTTRHDTTQHDTAQHNTTQHNTTPQHNCIAQTKHNAAQHNNNNNMTQDNTMAHIIVTVCRAVELGITAEDLASADDDFEDRSPRRPLAVAESDTEVTRAQVNYQDFAACIRHCSDSS